ncbi:50S ribosomal protein L17 [Candidatus Saccharibacteria bacterium]|nr:50S ribosomal protein L17 [Candidatus Saccharibacteria bacterium]
MHRHGYQGRKFGRPRAQRQALMTGLTEALILKGSVETTLPKAKELARLADKLISRAKAGSLADRRRIIRQLATLEAAHKLFDDLAPKLGKRASGFTRIQATIGRRGDGAQLATVSFVDDLSVEQKPANTTSKKTTEVKTADNETGVTQPDHRLPVDKQKITAAKPKNAAQAPKRTGFRGNR